MIHENDEQVEPLDLRKKVYVCDPQSPPFKKQKYSFCQIEPLDLSVKKNKNGEPQSQPKPDYKFKFPPVKKPKYFVSQSECLDLSITNKNPESLSKLKYSQGYKTNVSTQTENSQLNVLTQIQQKCSTVPHLEKIFLKFGENGSEAESSINTTPHESEIENIGNPFALPVESYNFLKKEYEKTNNRNWLRSLESESVDIIHNSSRESGSDSLTDTVKNISNFFKSSTFTSASINDDSFNNNLKSSNHPVKDPCAKYLLENTQNQSTKPSVAQLKKTGQSFLQDGKCFEVAPKLPRCRDCSLALPESLGKHQLDSGNVLCRFYAFRKLRYSTKGYLATAGFLDPYIDTTKEDLSLWQPVSHGPLPDIDLIKAKFVLSHVADQFCELYKQEEEAVSLHVSEDKKASWKRLVPEYREMCDVCNTTLFNYHWTCKTCGFAVCIDCYRARKGFMHAEATVERPWLICVNKRAHDQEKLMLTQIIAADSFKQLRQKVHNIRISLGLPLCHCDTQSYTQNNLCFPHRFSSSEGINFNVEHIVENDPGKNGEDFREKVLFPDSYADNADFPKLRNEDKTIMFEDYSSNKENHLARLCSRLKARLSKPPFKKSTPCPVLSGSNPLKPCEDTLNSDILEEVIVSGSSRVAVDDFNGCHESRPQSRDTRVLTLTESRSMYPDCPHSWLCEGRLLLLPDPSHAGNYKAFQDQWIRGQPVLVNGILQYLDKELWQPDSFIRDFGDLKNDLVNCMTGRVISGHYMRKFWEGFQEVSKMLKDDKGNPMLLKLKDWPPGEDFAELLPSRFEDLMKALPLGEYTKRSGQLNLPARLPSSFARPDLGPKMYIAYGSAIHPTKGTTNLHLDISDAVNVMVYVGIPKDIDHDEFMNEAYRAIDEACVEMVMQRRVREPGAVPGALWHIYSARDADKIRHLLTRVARERRVKMGPNQDPIHDQSWYLDSGLRDRLYREYNVRGYAIVQCLGDAVFIPAGAPHQVKNLLNCIKVAEDFVSPENVSHCLHLTQEFRKLSDFHTNHEDKLQIKNIIYHTVKDSVSVLSH